MPKDETSASDIRYPILHNIQDVVLPGDVVHAFIDDSQLKSLTDKLTQSGGKAFIPALPMPEEDNMPEIGTIGAVEKIEQVSGGRFEITFKAESRGRMHAFSTDGSVPFAKVETADTKANIDREFVDLFQETLGEFSQRLDESSLFKEQSNAIVNPFMLVYNIARHLDLDQDKKNDLLHTLDPAAQMLLVQNLMTAPASGNVPENVKNNVNKNPAQDKARDQRKADLTRIKKAIEIELKALGGGDDDEEEDELAVLKQQIKDAGMPDEVWKICEKELKRLGKMNPQSPEVDKTQQYLEEMIAYPWNKTTETEQDLKKARDKLDKSHYGLKDVKEFTIQDIAKQINTGKASGTVFGLIGEPGVGKTSVGQGIADATGRELIIIKMGGMTDESEIRGHRKTYVGAIPGRIIKAMQQAKTDNPIIMFDEVDKIGSNEVVAALLEVMDPAQNHAFRDRYMEVEVDLSKAMLMCTANYPKGIPDPLYDRMKKIYLDGYPDEEKIEIAKDFLIKKQMKVAGLTDKQFSITDKALAMLVEGYTREAGVRSLEQKIDDLTGKAAVQILEGKMKSVKITPENLEEYAGPKTVEREMVDPTPRVGHGNALAVTGNSGAVMEIQADMFFDPRGGTEATGNLSETIADSVADADAFTKANADDLGILPEVYLNNTLHVKVGRGGVPKDGPSAGLLIALAMISARTDNPIRGDVAMTGEISVLGDSGIIGGLPQKLDGAFKSGIKTVLIPEANLKDLEDPKFSAKLKENLEIMPDANAEGLAEVPEGKMRVIPVKNLMEVLPHALVETLEPLVYEENADYEEAPEQSSDAAEQLNDAALDKVARKVLESLLQRDFKDASKPAANDDDGKQQRPSSRKRQPATAAKRATMG